MIKSIFELRASAGTSNGPAQCTGPPGVQISGTVSEGVQGYHSRSIRTDPAAAGRRLRGERERGDRTLGSSERVALGSPATR